MEKSDLLSIRKMELISTYRVKKSPLNTKKARDKRPYCAIELKTSGKSIFINKNGVNVVSDPEHPIFLPKGCSYSWACAEPGECLVFEIDCEFVGNDIINFNVSDNSYIKKVFTNIELRNLSNNATNSLKNSRDLFAVLAYLLDSDNKSYMPKATANKLKPAEKYIAENYNQPGITNDLLASLCGISIPYFRRLFVQKYNRSPISYLNSVRMNKAMQMLKSDFISITQVANSVGFTNIYHFSKEFKLYTGVSPSEYANKDSNE